MLRVQGKEKPKSSEPEAHSSLAARERKEEEAKKCPPKKNAKKCPPARLDEVEQLQMKAVLNKDR